MKRKVSIASMLITVILILLSIEKVTMVGLLEGKCTFYQTISVSGKAFDLAANGVKTNNTIFIVLFFIAIALLFVPSFILFNQSKVRSIISIVFNVIGTIFVFLFLIPISLYMLITVCLLIATNIFLKLIENYKNGFDWFISAISALIGFLNIYYLVSHLQMWRFWDNGIMNGNLDKVIEEMMSISRVNMICYCLWIIPIVVLLCKEFVKKKKIEGV